MKHIKITIANSSLPPLPDVPEEFKLVESIARNYATDYSELENFYKVGLAAAMKYKEQCIGNTSNQYDRFVAWVVKQAILSLLIKK